MSDLTDRYLPRLKQHRLPGLALGDDFIYPHYQGYSILNLPATICQLLGVPEFGASPLSPELLNVLDGSVRRVILVLMDALSLHRLQRWLRDGAAPGWGQLVQEGILAPLTSIVPSTTSAALTSLWTGRPTAEHGIAGYELWLKEYGVVTNMITHAPISFQGDVGTLSKAGFQPENFLSCPTLGSHLAAHGVQTYDFQHVSIIKSGLSQMLYKDVIAQAFSTAADLWVNLRHLLETRLKERLYAWVYWGEVDHLSHFYGPDDERPAGEFAGFSMAFNRLFLSRLSPEARKDTVMIMIADHGQISTRKEARRDLRNHPELLRLLHILPTGENRMPYLFVRHGCARQVQDYFETAWPGDFILMESRQAAASGLFGSPPEGAQHPGLLDRLGDFVVVARGSAYLWWANKENKLLGRHGGISPDEMIVPFLAARL